MVAAFRVRNGRPDHVATNLIISGGWYQKYIYNHARIDHCYPVERKYVRIVARLAELSRGPGTKATTQIRSRLPSPSEAEGLVRLPDASGMGTSEAYHSDGS